VGLAPQLTRTQDAFCWFDPRPRDRSRLARAPFNVCPRSPRTLFTHRESAHHRLCGPPRQADPGLRREPCGPLRLPGKMRLPSVCNRLTTRALRWIVRSSNHRLHRLSPMMAASMSLARPKPWQQHDRVELRLTASYKLWHGVHDRPWFPGELSLLGPAGS